MWLIYQCPRDTGPHTPKKGPNPDKGLLSQHMARLGPARSTRALPNQWRCQTKTLPNPLPNIAAFSNPPGCIVLLPVHSQGALMATPAWDGEHDQPPNILQSFLTLSWKGIRSLAEFLVMRVVMLGLPSSYEARLKKLESSCGELLGVGLNPAETTMFQDVVKGCVFEWRECAVLNAAVLGYAFRFTLLPSPDPVCSLIGVLFSMTPDAPVWRMLLYLAFAVAFWALVIGKIYLAYFRHLQDSGEGGRWLFRVRMSPTTNRVAGIYVPRHRPEEP